MSATQTNGHGLDEALTEIMRIAQAAIDEEEAELAGNEPELADEAALAAEEALAEEEILAEEQALADEEKALLEEEELAYAELPEHDPLAAEAGAAGGNGLVDAPDAGCRLMALPERLADQAARVAVDDNPANAPLLELPGGVLEPQALAVLTNKYWGNRRRYLSTRFMEPIPADLCLRILSHLNAWYRTTNKRFVLSRRRRTTVRISRGRGGYYSYLGTDVLGVPQNRQTMNLEGFTMRTPESEFRRVVRHEAGHTLGFPHEHLRRALVRRIDPAKAYKYFRDKYGWSKQMVDRNVLTPLDEKSIVGTRPDQDSIMCYQLPGSITRDGRPIRGGSDINRLDYRFAARIYPKRRRSAPDGETTGETAGAASARSSDMSLTVDWDPSEDVAEPVPA